MSAADQKVTAPNLKGERLAADSMPNPLMVQVTRGDMVESAHRATVAVSDTAGHLVVAKGDVMSPVYARSAIKSIQAIPLVESGAADAFGLGDKELALACASHGGQPDHVSTVAAWLKKIGCGEDDLECGPQIPSHQGSMIDLFAAGDRPTRLHNNCSGKHSGFLTTARHQNWETKGYSRYDHPVQQQILGVLESMAGLDLSGAPRGIDGCGIPVIGIPLGNMALAMARMADPSDQPERRQEAIARLRRAQAKEPFMVAGSGRFCTGIMKVTGEKALVKTGAEGVFCAAFPDLGLGVALKVDDGTTRAAEMIMAGLLRHFEVISPDQARELANFTAPRVLNRAGATVGEIHLASDCPF